MSITQRPRFKLRDFVYAQVLTDEVTGTPTFDTVYSIPNIIEASFDSASSGTRLYGDDGPSFFGETVGDMKITINIADILPEHINRMLGHGYASGQITKKTTDQSNYLAIGFKIGRDAAVDEYFWYYKTKPVKPSVSAKTKAASVEWQTPTMEFAVLKLASSTYAGTYSMNMRTDDTNASSTTLTNFFTNVTLPGADNTSLTATIAEGTVGDAGKVVFTFVKGSSASFSLDSATCTSATLPVMTSAGLTAGTYVVGTAGTSVTVKFTPTTPFGSAVDVAAVVTTSVKDTSGVSATLAGDLFTTA